MQRRAGGGSHPAASSANPPIPTTIGGNRGGHFARRTKKKKFNPVLILMGAAVSLLCVSWYFFPTEVERVEREAEFVGHELAQKARQAEHQVEGWLHNNKGSGSTGGANGGAASAAQGMDPSERMKAQSSKWVDGEKKLKIKLKELAELQKKGEYLGAPVLTRWLGDDFPAWVNKDVNEEKWRKDVEAKYAQMRVEEEEWKKQMQQIIDKRERDIGITTA